MLIQRIKAAYHSFLNRRYSRIWNYLARQDSMKAILSVADSESEFAQSGKRDADWLKDRIPPNSVVLNIGCGIGRVESFFAPHCKEMHSVDISREMLQQATARLASFPNVFLQRLENISLSPFPDHKFDAVFSLLVLQHMDNEDAYRYLLEMNRVLKPGGICIVQFPNLEADKYFDAFLEFVRQETTARSIARTRCYTKQEVEFKMKRAGFEITEFVTNDTDMIAVARKTSESRL